MASTAGDSHSLPPPSAAASATSFLDDGHYPFFLPSSSTNFHDQASRFELPDASSHLIPATAAQGSPAPPTARKPPRKRPRASRRPQTTVLTTDASNFRAMVQEFTGFPAPPPFAGLPHLLRPAGGSNATSSLVLDALAMFAGTNGAAISAAAATAPSSGSDLYYGGGGGGYGPMLAGAVPFDDGFDAAEGERASAGVHGLFSSSFHAGERRY